MPYLVTCFDHPGRPELRMKNREAHLAYIAGSGAFVSAGGPLMSDDGARMIGSFLILDTDERSEAEAWSRKDPYAIGGVFESVTFLRWKWTVGPPASLVSKG